MFGCSDTLIEELPRLKDATKAAGQSLSKFAQALDVVPEIPAFGFPTLPAVPAVPKLHHARLR